MRMCGAGDREADVVRHAGGERDVAERRQVEEEDGAARERRVGVRRLDEDVDLRAGIEAEDRALIPWDRRQVDGQGAEIGREGQRRAEPGHRVDGLPGREGALDGRLELAGARQGVPAELVSEHLVRAALERVAQPAGQRALLLVDRPQRRIPAQVVRIPPADRGADVEDPERQGGLRPGQTERDPPAGSFRHFTRRSGRNGAAVSRAQPSSPSRLAMITFMISFVPA